MYCKNCPFYTLETVPVLDDSLQPIAGQFTKTRMCTADDGDICPAEVDHETTRCPVCGSDIDKNTDCPYCLAIEIQAQTYAAEGRQIIRDILEAS